MFGFVPTIYRFFVCFVYLVELCTIWMFCHQCHIHDHSHCGHSRLRSWLHWDNACPANFSLGSRIDIEQSRSLRVRLWAGSPSSWEMVAHWATFRRWHGCTVPTLKHAPSWTRLACFAARRLAVFCLSDLFTHLRRELPTIFSVKSSRWL